MGHRRRTRNGRLRHDRQQSLVGPGDREVDSDGTGPDLQIDLNGSGTIGDYTTTTGLDGNPRPRGTES